MFCFVVFRSVVLIKNVNKKQFAKKNKDNKEGKAQFESCKSEKCQTSGNHVQSITTEADQVSIV